MKQLKDFYFEHKGKVSDKWSLYLSTYERLFRKYCDKKISMLEIGVQNGGSLDIWAKYFPYAKKIVGCDINERCKKLIYDDDRISVVVQDANTDIAEKEILNFSNEYDLIIDDGSHRSSDIIKSFFRYFPYLKADGLFIAEDLHCSYWNDFEGGLCAPFSSIAFFKRLVDVINHEHWGVEKKREDILNGFCEEYKLTVKDTSFLSKIHSIEFVNSMCVIKKSCEENNILGERIVFGCEATVCTDSSITNGALCEKRDQSANKWSIMDRFPEEQIEPLFNKLKNFQDKIESISESNDSLKNAIRLISEDNDSLKKQLHLSHEEKKQCDNDRLILEERYEELLKENQKLKDIVISAKNWQKRSWFKRAFHRWRVPNFEKQGNFKRRACQDKKIRKYWGIILEFPRRWVYRKDYKLLKRSSLFNRSWYLVQNPDVEKSGISPRMHYLLFGGFEGRKPSLMFDSEWYLMQYPDVFISQMNPLVHYLKFGLKEGRQPLKSESVKAVGTSNLIALKRFHIVFISHDSSLTGAPVVLLHIMRWFHKHSLVNMRLILLGDGELTSVFSGLCDVFYSYSYSGKDRDVALQEFLGKEPIDLFYGNTVVASKIYDQIPLSIPVITHVHELEKSIQICLNKKEISRLFTRTNFFIAAASAVAKNLTDTHNVPWSKIDVIDSFISPNHEQESKDIRSELALPNSTRIIFGCGTVNQRKGVDLFIEVASILSKRGVEDIAFVWIGKEDGLNTDLLIRGANLEKIVFFVGSRSCPREYFLHGYLFLLPSREDPFPLVCLEAAECGLPIVCFEGAGSMPEFVECKCGEVVPYLDVEKMAMSVERFLGEESLKEEKGHSASVKLCSKYTADVAVPNILNICRLVASKPAPLSVIVPNYNYDKYIKQRIDSILNQTIRDFELIILDDCSTDESIAEIEPYCERSNVSLHQNKKNSGGVFKQWEKGFSLARGEYLWIAEADDFCAPTFLENVLSAFVHQDVSLSYSQSAPCDESGVLFDSSYLNYTQDLSSRWEENYIRFGVDEIEDTLFIKNTIPNASAVVFRKSVLNGLWQFLDFEMSGDWFAYVYALRSSKIAYCSKVLNFHRRHPQSVVHEMAKLRKNRIFDENIRIKKYMLNNFNISDYTFNRAMDFLRRDYKTTLEKDWNESKWNEIENGLREFAKNKLLKHNGLKILFVLSGFDYGGGEIAAIRYANFIAKTETVYLCSVKGYDGYPRLSAQISDRVHVLFLDDTDIVSALRSVIFDYKISIVSSHVWWADKASFFAIEKLNSIKWIPTLHGCYEALSENPDWDIDFNKILSRMVSRANAITYVADKNIKEILRVDSNCSGKLRKIANGYLSVEPNEICRDTLGISSEAFVIGMVGRGIPEKGWEFAIESVLSVNKRLERQVCLLMIGDGPFLDELAKKYKGESDLKFLGFQPNVPDWIAMADVGILPSFFPSESQPLSLIEFISLGKPVIASDIGDIPFILNKDKNELAGILLPLVDEKPVVQDIEAAILRLANDKEFYNVCSQNAIQSFNKFDMKKCAQNYLDLFQSIEVNV